MRIRRASVGVLYIAPLKALINDQFSRLNDLLAEAEIPVWHWHGDVPQSRKRKLLNKPSGILQITPESLESLMINKHMEIPSLFGDLRFIVIDEIHSLLRGDRGYADILSDRAAVPPGRMSAAPDRLVRDDRQSGGCRKISGCRKRKTDGDSAV